MTSWKAKKGNPFERKIAYNLMLSNYKVERLDDNTKGIDLVAQSKDLLTYPHAIECKFHKAFSWNEIVKIYEKTKITTFTHLKDYVPIVVFKSNQQPPLVMYKVGEAYFVQEFTTYFNCEFNNIPKGYKVWKK